MMHWLLPSYPPRLPFFFLGPLLLDDGHDLLSFSWGGAGEQGLGGLENVAGERARIGEASGIFPLSAWTRACLQLRL